MSGGDMYSVFNLAFVLIETCGITILSYMCLFVRYQHNLKFTCLKMQFELNVHKVLVCENIDNIKQNTKTTRCLEFP